MCSYELQRRCSCELHRGCLCGLQRGCLCGLRRGCLCELQIEIGRMFVWAEKEDVHVDCSFFLPDRLMFICCHLYYVSFSMASE